MLREPDDQGDPYGEPEDADNPNVDPMSSRRKTFIFMCVVLGAAFVLWVIGVF